MSKWVGIDELTKMNKTRTVEVKLINYGTFSGLKQTIEYTK